MAIKKEYLEVILCSIEKAEQHLHEMNFGKASSELAAVSSAIRGKLMEENQLALDLENQPHHVILTDRAPNTMRHTRRQLPECQLEEITYD